MANQEQYGTLDAREKADVDSIMRALETLPPDKRAYLRGYADGIIAMQQQQKSA